MLRSLTLASFFVEQNPSHAEDLMFQIYFYFFQNTLWHIENLYYYYLLIFLLVNIFPDMFSWTTTNNCTHIWKTLPAVLCTGILDVVNCTRFSVEQK